MSSLAFRVYYRFITKLFWKDDKLTFRYYYLARMVPGINLFYDLFFDEGNTSREAIKSLMDIFALLNALVLGAALALASAVTWDDSTKADELFRYNQRDGDNVDPYTGNAYKYAEYWAQYYDEPPSTTLFNYISTSLVLLFVDILILVYLYADSLAKFPSEEVSAVYKSSQHTIEELAVAWLKKQQEDDRLTNDADQLFQVWWSYAKYSMFLCVVFSFIACLYACLASGLLFNLKYPDYCLSNTGKFNFNFDSHCPTSRLTTVFKIIFSIAVIVTVLSTGLGTAQLNMPLKTINEKICGIQTR